jgi:hypothetical protein
VNVEGRGIVASDQRAQPTEARSRLMAYAAVDKILSEPQIIAEDRCGLEWVPWAPLRRDAVREAVPPRSGVYRIRCADGNLNRPVYIG